MEVAVERYQRKKYVDKEDSPMLYYIRQKTGTVRVADIDSIAEQIQSKTSLTAGNVKHSIVEVVDQLRTMLVQGNKVKIDGLGTFHMTLTCLGSEKKDDCTVKCIKRVNIRFIPDKALKLVNESRALTRSPNNVTFALDKPSEKAPAGGGEEEGGGDDPVIS